MNILKLTILCSLFLIISGVVNAQQLKEDEVVVIKGEKYILHQVRTGETIFSISRDFKIDRSVLIQNNPKIEAGLNIGENLKIPYRDDVTLKQIPIYKKGDPTRFEFHTIKSRKETPYFIAKNYGITVEEIYSYNPVVGKYKKGTKIRIPIWDEIEEVTIDEVEVDQQEQETELTDISEFPVIDEISPNNIANYFEHIIESGETMWGITRKYGVSELQLVSLNPLLENGFPAGAVIKIPVEYAEPVKIEPVNEDAFLNHEIEKGETLYGLSARYNLKISEIKKYNPILEKRGLLRGETILIPRKQEPVIIEQIVEEQEVPELPEPEIYNFEIQAKIPEKIPETCQPVLFNQFENITYNIALFLPLFVEANDTLNKKIEILEPVDSLELSVNQEVIDSDTLIEEVKKEDMFIGFYRSSENFLQFYEGVLLAVDSMQSAGMNIKLNVFDTQQNTDSVRKYIHSADFLRTDLIIGPVYPAIQKEVAAISAKNRIPMVSPLSGQSVDIQYNPYFYQVNPDRDYLAARTAEMVAEEYFNSNFVVFRSSNYIGTQEEELVNLIQEKFYNSGFMGRANGVNFSIYDFQNDGPFGLRRILSKEKENVFYIPSSDEGELSVAISNINNLADEYSITLIGSSRFQQYESIQIDYFHNLKLEYISPYWVDYKKSSTINFIENFKTNFYSEPDSYGFQGYDVTFYFLNALKIYGHDFQECLPYMQLDLVQGNYQFEKVSQLGGYMNQGVSVIAYERDFDVVRKRVEGQLSLAGN